MVPIESITDYLKGLAGDEVQFLPKLIHTIDRITEVQLPKPIHYMETNAGHSSKIIYEVEIGNAGKVSVLLNLDDLQSLDPLEYLRRKAEAIRLDAIVSAREETVGLGMLEGLYNECFEPTISGRGTIVPKKLGMEMYREVADKLDEMQRRGELDKYRDRRKAGREIMIGPELVALVGSGDFQCTSQHYYLSPDYPASDVFVLAAIWRVYIYSRINFEEFPQAILKHMCEFFQRGATHLALWKGTGVNQANTMSFISTRGKNCEDLGVLLLERK